MNPLLIAPENHEERSIAAPVPEEDRDFYVRLHDVEPMFEKGGKFRGMRLIYDGFSKWWFDKYAGAIPEPSGDTVNGPLVWRDMKEFVAFYDEARIYRLEVAVPYPLSEPWRDIHLPEIGGGGSEAWLEKVLRHGSLHFDGRFVFATPSFHWDGPWHLVETEPGPGSPMLGASGAEQEAFSEGGILASVHANLYRPGPLKKVMQIRPADWERQMNLSRATNTNHVPHATNADVRRLLSGVINNGVDFAVAYDVGQGGCHGLCNAQGEVLAYYDFGGGVTGNAKTYPPNLNHFCFKHNPPIILSHWDADHWAAAGVDQRSLSADWLAPDQTHLLTAAATAQVAAIQKNGTLRYYTNSVTPQWHGQVYLELATGPVNSTNNTGIALTLSEHSGGGGLKLLMPGDAEYMHVGSFIGGPQYHTVVAPHHGGHLSNATVPVCSSASSNCRMAYSCGPGNTHHHPLVNTITWHQHAAWHHHLPHCPTPIGGVYEARLTSDRTPRTGLGHILLAWPGTSLASITYHPTCNTTSGSCDLAPQQ